MRPSRVAIRRVASRGDLGTFVRLPARLYRQDPAFVSPLLGRVRASLERWTDPKRGESALALFLALRQGRVVGRVSAHLNPSHNRYHGDRRGFFGFFECEDDEETARSLIAAAARWQQRRGMTEMVGPMSFTIHDEVGVLIEGFEHPPYVLTPHSRPYYAQLLEGAALRKVKDLYAWRYDPRTPAPVLLDRAQSWLAGHPEVVLRSVEPGRLERELAVIAEVFNDAWADNWGFVPLGAGELARAAAELGPVLDARDALIVEIDRRPAAVCVAVRNFNEALSGLRGRLLPLGWARLWWRLRVAGLTSARLLLLGVRREFRRYGLGLLVGAMLAEIRRRGLERGYLECELSWTLEDNRAVNRLIRRMGAEHYKTYRVYGSGLPLSAGAAAACGEARSARSARSAASTTAIMIE